MLKQKVIRAETKVVDEESGRVSAVLSTESKDRDGDIIRQRFWDLEQFNKHPVLLSSHNYYSLQSQIGEWEDVAVRGKRLVGTARYFIGQGNAESDWGFKLAQQGRAAYSVGFIPDMDKAKPIDDKDVDPFGFAPMEFRGQTLLECSHVTVPSNPDALQRMKQLSLPPELKEIVDEMTEHDEQKDVAGRIAEMVLAGIDYEAIVRQINYDAIAERVAGLIDVEKESAESGRKGLARW